MSAKSCEKCGGPLPVQSGRGRRRVRCESCAPSRNQKPKRTPLAVLPTGGDSLVDATMTELERADVVSSALGQAALLLARGLAGSGGAVCVAGSLYLVAEVLRLWQAHPLLSAVWPDGPQGKPSGPGLDG